MLVKLRSGYDFLSAATESYTNLIFLGCLISDRYLAKGESETADRDIYRLQLSIDIKVGELVHFLHKFISIKQIHKKLNAAALNMHAQFRKSCQDVFLDLASHAWLFHTRVFRRV